MQVTERMGGRTFDQPKCRLQIFFLRIREEVMDRNEEKMKYNSTGFFQRQFRGTTEQNTARSNKNYYVDPRHVDRRHA